MKRNSCRIKTGFSNGIINGYSWYPLKGEFLFAILFSQLSLPRGASWPLLTPAAARSSSGPVESLQPCPCPLTAPSQEWDGRLRDAQTCSLLLKLPEFRRLFSIHFAAGDCAKKDEQDTDLQPTFDREEPRPSYCDGSVIWIRTDLEKGQCATGV